MSKSLFTKNFQYICKIKSINIKHFSKKINRNKSTLSNYLNGVSEPNASILVQICEALNVSPNFMLLRDIESEGGLKVLGQKASFVPFGKNVLNEELSEYRMQPFAAGSVPPTSSAFLGKSSDLGTYRERLADKEQIIRLLTAENERLKKECETLKKQIDKK